MSNVPYDISDVIIANDEILLSKFSGGESRNIYNLVTQIYLHESLTNATLSADIYLAEGIELINNFPMNGEEFIEFTFQTPLRKEITVKLFVESIDNQITADNSLIKSYVLRCVTEDYLKNSFHLFSRRFTDMNYDVAVTSIMNEELKTNKSIEVESTKGKFDYVVNAVRPLQAIDLIRERAVSGERNESSLFFFYEDNEQYRFLTLEKLIEDRKEKSKRPDYIFVYDTANRASPYDKVINYRNILSYRTINQGTTIEKVKRGRMRNQIREFDIRTGAYYTKKEYINLVDNPKFKKIDESWFDFNSDVFNGYVTEFPAVSEMVVKDSTRPEMEHNKTIHMKRPFADKLHQYSVHLRVYGDTDVLLGDTIRLSIPEITGTSIAPPEQEIFAQNYIIFSQTHKLEKRTNDGRFSYYMNLDLRKPNLQGKGIS